MYVKDKRGHEREVLRSVDWIIDSGDEFTNRDIYRKVMTHMSGKSCYFIFPHAIESSSSNNFRVICSENVTGIFAKKYCRLFSFRQVTNTFFVKLYAQSYRLWRNPLTTISQSFVWALQSISTTAQIPACLFAVGSFIHWFQSFTEQQFSLPRFLLYPSLPATFFYTTLVLLSTLDVSSLLSYHTYLSCSKVANVFVLSYWTNMFTLSTVWLFMLC